MACQDSEIFQYLLRERGYIVIQAERFDPLPASLPIGIEHRGHPIEYRRWFPVLAQTNRKDYKAQTALLLERFHKMLGPIPAGRCFYRLGHRVNPDAALSAWTAALAHARKIPSD